MDKDKLIIEKLKVALDKIANPIKFMQDNLKEGESLNGLMALQLANSPIWLKQIAEDALSEISSLESQGKEPDSKFNNIEIVNSGTYEFPFYQIMIGEDEFCATSSITDAEMILKWMKQSDQKEPEVKQSALSDANDVRCTKCGKKLKPIYMCTDCMSKKLF